MIAFLCYDCNQFQVLYLSNIFLTKTKSLAKKKNNKKINERK